MKRLAQLAVALLLLALVLLVAAPFTAQGSRLLLGLVPASSPLQLDYHSGSLLGELRLRRLRLKLDALSVEISDWHSQLRPGCLWRSEFCIEQLRLGAVAVVLADTGAQPGEEASEAVADEMLTLPFRLQAPSVQVERLQLQWRGGRWQQGRMQLALAAAGSTVRLEKLHITAAELELEATATADPDTGPEPLLLPELFLPLELVVEDLRLQRPRWRFGELEHRHESLSLRGSWEGWQLQLMALELASEDWGSVQLQGDLELGGAWPLAVDAALQFARPQPVPELLWERRLLLRLDGQADDLQLSLDAPGTPGGELQAQVDLLDPELPFQLTATLAGDEPLPLAEILGPNEALPDLALAMPLQLHASGNLSAQSVEATATLLGAGYQALRLDAELSHSDQRVQIEQLQLTDEASDSRLQLDGSVVYGAALEWQLALQSAGFSLPELDGPLNGRLAGSLLLTGEWRDQDWQLALDEVDLRGEVNGLPAQAGGDLQLNSRDYVAAGELQVDINAAELVLSRGQGSGATAALVLRVEDLARWRAGSRGRLVLEGELREQASSLDIKGSVDDLLWNGLAVDQGELQGELALVPTGAVDARLNLMQLRIGELYLDQISLLAQGTYDAPRLELRSSGDISGAIRLAARQRDGDWSAELTTTGIDTPLGPLTLDEAVAISYTDGSARLTAHCWRLPASRLCSEDWTLAASGGGSARLDGDLALFAALLPQDLELSGDLTAQVSAQWEPATGLRANASVDSSEGQLTQFYPEGESASLHWESVQARLEQGSEGLILNAVVRREQQTALQFDLQLPPQREQELAGSVEVNEFQLAALRPFMPDLSRLEGVLSGQLRVAGTLDAPELFGRLQLSGAELGLNNNPTELKAVELALDLTGERANLTGSANLGGGELELSGSAELRPEPTLELLVKGDRNRLLYPPSTRLVASPDLRLRISAGQLLLRGEVAVHSGLLAYEQLPAGSVAVSPDVVEVDYDGKPLTADEALALDAQLRVRISDRFQVRGKDLEVTVGGDLTLEQAPGRPLQIFGNLNVIGGEFRAYGQRLQVKQGRISFTGLPENPELNLRAEREIPADDVTAGVVVSGTLEEPLLQVYSEPAMSQTEALSYLVRGRGLDSGAGADGTAMALSVGTGLVNKSAVVEGLNRLPGLRNVEFGTAGTENETAATVSGYIGERIYVSYGVGLYEPVNALTARLYLQTRLWLEVVSRLESSVDLYYSFDID